MIVDCVAEPQPLVLALLERGVEVCHTRRIGVHRGVFLVGAETLDQFSGQPIGNRESIGVGDVSRHVTEILAYVKAYNGIDNKTLWRHMLPIMSPQEFETATRAAIKAGYMKLDSQSMRYRVVKERKKDE